MAAADDRRRGAAVYGRDPDPELVAALVAAAPSGPAPNGGEEAPRAQPPTRGVRSRRQALVATLVIAAAVLAVGVAVQVGALSRRAAPPFEPGPTVTAISDELTRTRTVPVTIDGLPPSCRFMFEFTPEDPSPRWVAGFTRFASFAKQHRWIASQPDSGSARTSTSSRSVAAERSRLVTGAVREGVTAFGARPADADWLAGVEWTLRSQCNDG